MSDRPRTGSSYAERPWRAAYPDGVPADVDVPPVPLTQLLDDAARSYPNRPALVCLGRKISYRQLREEVDAFAAALARLGVSKGDRVATVLPNCPQNVIAFFASLRLGAVVVQNNPLYTEAELHHQLRDAGARVVVCLDRTYPTLAAARRELDIEHVVVTSIADYLPRRARVALRAPLPAARARRAELVAPIPPMAPLHRFLALRRSAREPAGQAELDPASDLAVLQYTGGTSGVSRGAMLTHTNLVANAYQNRLWLADATPGAEVVLTVLPLFHAFGLTTCLTTGILLGATLVLLPRFDLDIVLAAIDDFAPTLFPGVPPIYAALADSPKLRDHNLRSLRTCVSGAMRLPERVQEGFERASGARLIEGYGLTEASPSTHANPVNGTRKPGSVGVPLPGTQCRVVDIADHHREVAVGEPGELAVRGPQVFAGYWNAPEESATVLVDDGWLLTGDIAVMDDDGYFSLVDRKKDVVIAGGFNVYPAEVEEVLAALPEVAECAVAGVPDRYRGENVKAYVVLRPGAALSAAAVIEHCARSLTAYKVPKQVEFRDSLPRTAIGKVARRRLEDAS